MYKKQPKLLSDGQKKILVNAIRPIFEVLINYDYDASEMFEEYFAEAMRQDNSGELITHLNDNFVRQFDYRHGADTVMGTLGQYLVHACYLREDYIVKEMSDRDSQRNEMDLASRKPHTESFKFTSVKNNHVRPNGSIRLGSDYFEHVGPDVNYIAFADIYNLTTHQFDVEVLRDYFNEHQNPSNDNNYIYKQLNQLPSHEALIL